MALRLDRDTQGHRGLGVAPLDATEWRGDGALDAIEWRGDGALDATEWRESGQNRSWRANYLHSTPPSGTKTVHSTPPSGTPCRGLPPTRSRILLLRGGIEVQAHCWDVK